MHILWHDNHRKWFRLLRDMTPWSWLWYPQKTSIFTILGLFQSKPGHVPRCINRSVLHLRRPTNISICTLYTCTYYDMTTIGNGLDYLEIWPPEADFGTPRKPRFSPFWGHFQANPGHVAKCVNYTVLGSRSAINTPRITGNERSPLFAINGAGCLEIRV